jgi:hypothetical protein
MKIIEHNIGMPILFACSPIPDLRVLPVSNRWRNVLIIDAALDAALDAAMPRRSPKFARAGIATSAGRGEAWTDFSFKTSGRENSA